MPYSYGYFKEDFKQHLFSNFNKNIQILDVGAGSGSYGLLLNNNFKNIDCIEIYEPYIDQFNLRNIYRSVILGDIKELNLFIYDYIILGDVLEHLSIEDSSSLLNKIYNNDIYCMVAIPFEMKQDEVGGNIYEKHHQDDLTNEIFLTRYPMMNLLFKNEHYGYYVNYNYEYTCKLSPIST